MFADSIGIRPRSFFSSSHNFLFPSAQRIGDDDGKNDNTTVSFGLWLKWLVGGDGGAAAIIVIPALKVWD